MRWLWVVAVVGLAACGGGGGRNGGGSAKQANASEVRDALIGAGATCEELQPPAGDAFSIEGVTTTGEAKCILDGVEVSLDEFASPSDRRGAEQFAKVFGCGFLPEGIDSYSYFASGSWTLSPDELDVEHADEINGTLAGITGLDAITVECP